MTYNQLKSKKFMFSLNKMHVSDAIPLSER